MRVGEMLVGRGMATPAQIDAALQRQKERGGLIGNHLLAMGVVTPTQLADLLRDQRDLASALPICTAALEKWESLYGPADARTNRARSNLAKLLIVAGCASEALQLCQQALPALDRAVGPDHPWTIDAARVIADAQAAVNRVAKIMTPA